MKRDFSFLSLAEADRARGAVVVIDVLRAFTTAAFAFERGANRILPVSTVDEALSLQQENPGALVMGEVDGFKPEQFDLSNSPGALWEWDLAGRTLIQRTSAGTQGLVRAIRADSLCAASFVMARATAQMLNRSQAKIISFVITGLSQGRDGDEDLACAEYIRDLVMGTDPDPEPYLGRVATSTVGRDFSSGSLGYLLQEDFNLSVQVNHFNFAMPVRREAGRLVMTREPVEYRNL
ncbi:MAG: 2-phosphosulfolactate phosphatase [Anaerolineaceae bacterium]|nr:2-phosphosulfolactate phosphatase [Anaerolineaceae bacterium]